MTLAELGAKLREAREARNLTVADAADWLKIPTRILEGVEEGADHLPRTVYVYHFIKDYAKYLGFSAEEAGSWVSSVEGFENVSRPVIAESVPFTPVKPSVLPMVLGGLLKLGVLAALAFGAYTAYVHFFAGRDYEEIISTPPAQEQAAPAASVPAAPVWEPAAPAVPAEQGSGKAGPVAPAQEKEEKAEAAPVSGSAVPVAPQWDAPAAQDVPAEPAVVQAQEPEPVAPAGQSAALAEAAVSAPAAPAEAAVPVSPLPAHVSGHVEVIADAGDCWMGFEVDGRKQQRFLRKGASFTMSFRDSLELKLGDAGAVRVLYNGRELERAAAGRVLTLRFPPSE